MQEFFAPLHSVPVVVLFAYGWAVTLWNVALFRLARLLWRLVSPRPARPPAPDLSPWLYSTYLSRDHPDTPGYHRPVVRQITRRHARDDRLLPKGGIRW